MNEDRPSLLGRPSRAGFSRRERTVEERPCRASTIGWGFKGEAKPSPWLRKEGSRSLPDVLPSRLGREVERSDCRESSGEDSRRNTDGRLQLCWRRDRCVTIASRCTPWPRALVPLESTVLPLFRLFRLFRAFRQIQGALAYPPDHFPPNGGKYRNTLVYGFSSSGTLLVPLDPDGQNGHQGLLLAA